MSDIEKVLEEVSGLISLPEVYLRVRRLMDDPSSDVYDFAEVISVDANLSMRVLKVVNSAYFGFPEPVESIARAVGMIGIGPLHNMVLSVAAISSLELPNDILPLNAFWRTSLLTGVLARLLAQKVKLPKSEAMFIAGLLHEIGHLVLYAKLPQEAEAARKLAEEQRKPIHEAELQLLGFHYGDVGAMLMAHWNLPERLQSLTRHQPFPAGASDFQVETALLHLAHQCAQRTTQEFADAADNPCDAESLALTGLSQEVVENSLDEARSISADMEKVILA